MNLQAPPSGNPVQDLFMLVNTQVVHNEVEFPSGVSSIQVLEKLQKLFVIVGVHTASLNSALMNSQCRKKTRCPMAFISRSKPLGLSRTQGERGLSTVQGLDLGFLFYAKDQSIFRGDPCISRQWRPVFPKIQDQGFCRTNVTL